MTLFFSRCLFCAAVFLISVSSLEGYENPQIKSGQKTSNSRIDSNSTHLTILSRYFQPTPGQLLKLWMIQHQSEIWQEVKLTDRNRAFHTDYGFRNIFGRYDNAVSTYPGLEVRESSIYIPQNVRDYTDYKMGRDRYLQIANPLLIGYMIYHIGRYARQFFNDDGEPVAMITLTDSEQKMLQLLKADFPLDVTSWYDLYISNSMDSALTLQDFNMIVIHLEEQDLVKPRIFEDGTLKYYPNIERTFLKIKK